MQSTTDFDQFTFLKDNRDISHSHVAELVEKIKMSNMLELEPIIVNEKMEVMNGQHRLLAAKRLGVPIYYKVVEGLTSVQMRMCNLNRQWTDSDYLKHYIANDFEEYKKLYEFMLKQSLRLNVAMNLAMGSTHDLRRNFRDGTFKFRQDLTTDNLEMCKETISTIKRLNGQSIYLDSVRFWRAMILLISHKDFDMCKWISNLSRMCTRMGVKASMLDYLNLMTSIYNWRNPNKIHLTEENLLCDT
jgi:hypothetical protein